MKGCLDQLFVLEPADKSAADSKQLRVPTLEERVELYLHAVYGNRDFTKEEYSRARRRILDAMAANVVAKSGVHLGSQTLTQGASPQPAVIPIPPAITSWDYDREAASVVAPRIAALEGNALADVLVVQEETRLAQAPAQRLTTRRISISSFAAGAAASVALLLFVVPPIIWRPTDQNSSGSILALAPVTAVAPVAPPVAAGAPAAPVAVVAPVAPAAPPVVAVAPAAPAAVVAPVAPSGSRLALAPVVAPVAPEVSFLTRDLNTVLPRAKIAAVAPIDEVLARVREAANWDGNMAQRPAVLASALPSTLAAYAPERNAYAGFKPRIVPENVSLLPKRSVRTVRVQTKATPEEIAETVRRGFRPTDQNSSGSRLALARVAPVAPPVATASAFPTRPDEPDPRDLAQPADITAIDKAFQDHYARGNYPAAQIEAQKLERLVKARFGADHPYYAVELNKLASVYQAQGKYGEAEGLHKRALAIREKALGASHPDVAQTLNNLASVYEAQGKYGEAEALYQRALTIREETLGASHPDVANILENLAIVYKAQGKYSEAEGLNKRAVAILGESIPRRRPD